MRYPRSRTPWVRKCGKLPIWETLAIMWPYTDCLPACLPARLSHRYTNAKFRVVCGEDFFGTKTNGNLHFVNHKQLRSTGKSTQNKKKLFITVMKSWALLQAWLNLCISNMKLMKRIIHWWWWRLGSPRYNYTNVVRCAALKSLILPFQSHH